MKREILFRGKRADNGEWVHGYLNQQGVGDKLDSFGEIMASGDFYISLCGCNHKVDPATVGQYTGLTDKNGKKIFEGDIIWEKYDKPDIDGKTHTMPEVVEYEAGLAQFIMRQGKCVPDEMDASLSRTAEVIGNVWDSPELLEGDGHE